MTIHNRGGLAGADSHEPRPPRTSQYPRNLRVVKYDGGATPCRQCLHHRHKRCTAGDCTCSCTSKRGPSRQATAQFKAKYERGRCPCRACQNGMHKHCKHGACSCSCREEVTQPRMFETEEITQARMFETKVFVPVSFLVLERKVRRD